MTFKELRERSGLSVYEVARRIGRDRSTVNKIERGEIPDPRYSTIVGIAGVFATSPEVVARAIANTCREAA